MVMLAKMMDKKNKEYVELVPCCMMLLCQLEQDLLKIET
jgi:hypothetical protein